MAILAGARADAADLAALGGSWTTYTPTFGNVTSGAGTFAYALIGKTLLIRGAFTAGTVTAAAVVTVSLPASLQAVVIQPVPCMAARVVRGALASAGNVEITDSAGANLAAASALLGTRFNGVLEVA